MNFMFRNRQEKPWPAEQLSSTTESRCSTELVFSSYVNGYFLVFGAISD
jgi:hypothetical protein